MLLVALAVSAALGCPVERAHYALRHTPGVSLDVIETTASRDWPSGLAFVVRNRASGHALYFLPWNGGTDGRQNLAHTTDVTRPDFQLPSPDGGPGRLGDMEFVAMDEAYDVRDAVPVRGEGAPAHILIPDLSSSGWKEDSVVKAFFDFESCRPARP
jgi:hypothetical protein